MLRQACPADIPQITALWSAVFGDSEAVVQRFFAAFPNCLSYVAEEAGQIVAMVHALPQTLSPDLPAAYVYAVATLPAHRGRGLCRRLMDFGEQDLYRRGFACCVLVPAEAPLFRFYEKQGYETAFFRRRTAFSGGFPISTAQYAQLREQLLTVPHMVYDRSTLEYAAESYGLTFYQTATGIAAAAPDYTAEVLPEDLGGEAFAMVKWLGPPRAVPDAYLGFALE